jgi:hypothetical protein
MTSTSPRLSIKMLTDLIKAGSIIASISAILYLYGFGLSARINILAYVGLTDFIRVAIGWIAPPFCLQFVLGYFGPNMVSSLREPISTESEVGDVSFNYKRRMGVAFKCTLGFFVALTLVLTATALLHSNMKLTFMVLTLLMIVGWMMVIVWRTNSVAKLRKTSYNSVTLQLLVPIFFIYSIGSGLAHGARTGMAKSDSDLVVVSTDSDTQLSGELLFSFDKFIVVRENGHAEITLIPYDKVTSIKISALVTPPTVSNPVPLKK